MAIIALMEHELVRKRRGIGKKEFVHGVGLSQILGPSAVNTALFTGYRLYGTLGGLIAASAFMAPSLVLVLILSWLYFSYHAIPALQGAVAGHDTWCMRRLPSGSRLESAHTSHTMKSRIQTSWRPWMKEQRQLG